MNAAPAERILRVAYDLQATSQILFIVGFEI
jgi:hypothetical protein